MRTIKELYDAEPNWKKPLIIESHINGARSKAYNPNIPIGYEEVANEIATCWEAGACGIHLHNSDPSIVGEAAYEDYMKSLRPALEKHPDLFWYSTLTDTTGQSADVTGLEHAELLAQRAGMKVCCVDCGSANLPYAMDEQGNLLGMTYHVPFDRINKQVALCNRNGLGIIWGIYEPGYLRTALQYIKNGLSPKGSSLDFYLQGDFGLLCMQPINTCGLPPTIDSLYQYLTLMGDCDLPWFVSIWGAGSQDTHDLMKRVIELGGHIKTGLELHYDPERNPTNVELLQEVQEIAKEVGRPLATQQEAKSILGLT